MWLLISVCMRVRLCTHVCVCVCVHVCEFKWVWICVEPCERDVSLSLWLTPPSSCLARPDPVSPSVCFLSDTVCSLSSRLSLSSWVASSCLSEGGLDVGPGADMVPDRKKKGEWGGARGVQSCQACEGALWKVPLWPSWHFHLFFFFEVSSGVSFLDFFLMCTYPKKEQSAKK